MPDILFHPEGLSSSSEFLFQPEAWANLLLPLYLEVRIERDLFNPGRQLVDRWLTREHRGIERAMTEQRRQASDIIGVPERMSTRLLGKVDPTGFNQLSDHLRDV